MPHFNALAGGDSLRISGQTLPIRILEGLSYQMLKTIYDFLLVINSVQPPILRRFQVMAEYWSNFSYR